MSGHAHWNAIDEKKAPDPVRSYRPRFGQSLEFVYCYCRLSG
jgi:hypothetical protein